MMLYYIGIGSITLPIEAENDNDARDQAHKMIVGNNYHGIRFWNSTEGRTLSL